MTDKRGLAMGVLIFASFMDLLDATIVNVALPRSAPTWTRRGRSSSGWSAATCWPLPSS